MKDGKYITTQEDTVQANEEIRKSSLTILDIARDFVCAFNVIGCGGNEFDSACALEDSDLLILNALRESLFTQGVINGLPDELDAVSLLFGKDPNHNVEVEEAKIRAERTSDRREKIL